jgi:hypothetical protein
MPIKVWLQLHNGEERIYDHATCVDYSNRHKVIVESEHTVLAVIDKSDLKNLLTDSK